MNIHIQPECYTRNGNLYTKDLKIGTGDLIILKKNDEECIYKVTKIIESGPYRICTFRKTSIGMTTVSGVGVALAFIMKILFNTALTLFILALVLSFFKK